MVRFRDAFARRALWQDGLGMSIPESSLFELQLNTPF